MAWEKTHHFTTFNEMHRKPEAREIAEKLHIGRMKVEAVCLNCHYTSQVEEGKTNAKWGISCESCHGAAKDWNDRHYDFGGKGTKKENETPEHRQQRIERSKAAGMIFPSDTYSLAANCFGCHTVPQEDLVNAGHKAGSDFELVAWSQGEVRHNFSANQKVNAQPTPQHKRLLLVTGRILDLEYSLRAAAKSTKEGPFATAMAKRVSAALGTLQQVAQAVPSVELKEMLAVGNAVELKINNGPALVAAADKVAALAKNFAQANDGDKLAAVDSLLPTEDKYKGKAFQLP